MTSARGKSWRWFTRAASALPRRRHAARSVGKAQANQLRPAIGAYRDPGKRKQQGSRHGAIAGALVDQREGATPAEEPENETQPDRKKPARPAQLLSPASHSPNSRANWQPRVEPVADQAPGRCGILPGRARPSLAARRASLRPRRGHACDCEHAHANRTPCVPHGTHDPGCSNRYRASIAISATPRHPRLGRHTEPGQQHVEGVGAWSQCGVELRRSAAAVPRSPTGPEINDYANYGLGRQPGSHDLRKKYPRLIRLGPGNITARATAPHHAAVPSALAPGRRRGPTPGGPFGHRTGEPQRKPPQRPYFRGAESVSARGGSAGMIGPLSLTARLPSPRYRHANCHYRRWAR